MNLRAVVAGVAILVAACGAAARTQGGFVGTFSLNVPAGPYFPGSRIRVAATGVDTPVSLRVLGPGIAHGNVFAVPASAAAGSSFLVASLPGAAATTSIRFVPPPIASALIAVASYDNGIVLHDARTFRVLGYVSDATAVGDVTFSPSGDMFAPDTDGTTMLQVALRPWNVRSVRNVLVGNEVVYDPRTNAAFVSDRDAEGGGGLTKIAQNGKTERMTSGTTPEGLALDSERGRIYVGNVNDSTIAEFDTTTMQLVRRFPAVQRVFGLALDPVRRQLYAVSNTTRTTNGSGGFVARLDLASGRIMRRSPPLRFPLGAALDQSAHRLFVTDESADAVYVLEASTLALRATLHTCRTPWRPRVANDLLFVPCMRSDAIDVFDVKTLRRRNGAPFATGGTPLGVAVWNAPAGEHSHA